MSDRGRKPVRRWFRRIVVLALCVAALVALAAGAVQIALTTDLPRSLVEEALQDATGLDVTVASVRTGWSGETALQGLRIAIPLADRPLLEIDEMNVGHTGLLWLLLQQPLQLDRVTATHPRLYILQDSGGAWNIQRAMQSIQSAQDDESGGGGPIELPDVDFSDAVVTIAPLDLPPVTLEPVQVRGEKHGRVRWDFDIAIQDQIAIEGALATAAPWRHDVRFDAERIGELVEPWFEAAIPQPTRLAGQWTGQPTADGVDGRLSFEELAFDDEIEATGTLDVTVRGRTITARPEAVVVHSAGLPGAMRINGGSVSGDATNITVSQLQINHPQVAALLNGRWDSGARQGQAEITWVQEGAHPSAGNLTHRGHAALTASLPRVGPMRATMEAGFDVAMADRQLDGQVEVRIEGQSVDALNAEVSAPELVYRDSSGPVDISGARVRGWWDGNVATMNGLELPGAIVRTARATYDTDAATWSADVDLREWVVPRLNRGPVSLVFVGEGSDTTADFSRLVIEGDQMKLTARGTYQADAPAPLAAHADLQFERVDDGQMGLDAVVQVQGSIDPLDLRYLGEATGRDVPIGPGVVPEIEINIDGRVTDERATFATGLFRMFDGVWDVDGVYDMGTEDLNLSVSGSNASMSTVADAFAVQLEVAGRISATLDVQLPRGEIAEATVDGGWDVVDLSARGIRGGRGRGRIHTHRGEVRITDARIEDERGHYVSGEASMNLAQRDAIHLDLAVNQWPAVIEETSATITADGTTKLTVNPVEGSASGPFDFRFNLTLPDRPRLGHIDLRGDVRGRTLDIHTINGQTLDGNITGSAMIPIDAPLTTEADVDWHGVDLTAIGPLLPDYRVYLEDLRGDSEGTLSVRPSEDSRRPDTLSITASGTTIGGRYAVSEIGDLDLQAFVTATAAEIQRLRIDFSGGEVTFWGRSTRHADDQYVHGVLEFSGLDLDQLVHTVQPEAPPAIGRIAGRATLGTYIGHPTRSFGKGRIALTKADLGAVPLFDVIYDSLKFRFGDQEPTGFGEATFRLEGRTLEIDRVEYFNRGSDIVARLTVDDVTLGGDSPIRGLAVGAVRPFRELDLPLLGAGLDDFVQAIQADATSVRIAGTVAERQLEVVPFAEVSRSARTLLRAVVGE